MLELLMGFGLRGGGDREPLVAGTYEHGYYGEVPASDFITGNQLINLTGLVVGAPINSNTNWLKFSLDNKTLYVTKLPILNFVAYQDLELKDLVLGNRQLIIKNSVFKVRLLKGLPTGTYSSQTGYDLPSTYGSEWNRLMYHVSASPNNGTMTSEGIAVGDWAQFSNGELGLNSNQTPATICQEKVGSANYISRSTTNNLSYIATGGISGRYTNLGWRPVLELVE